MYAMGIISIVCMMIWVFPPPIAVGARSQEYLQVMLDRSKRVRIAGNPTCTECEFSSIHRDPQNLPNGPLPNLVRMTTTSGIGRTGNSVTAMFNAMKLAYLCKSALELPRNDSHKALYFQERLFDFTQRPGEASACLPLGVTHRRGEDSDCLPCEQKFVADARSFFYLSSPSKLKTTTFKYLSIDNATDVPMDAEVENKLWTCMRQYLGICVEGMCYDHPASQEGVLVVHLRQGDIYKPDYSGQVHWAYQQPPLAYYYSIINFTNPDKVIFVGEDVNHGPVWDAFEDLQSFGMTKFAIEFQSTHLWEDLDTMLCARNLVESKSTLMTVARLGFAVKRFTPYAVACRSAFPAQQVYFVDSGKFGNGRHTNSAEEWVAMLLRGKAFSPRLCNG